MGPRARYQRVHFQPHHQAGGISRQAVRLDLLVRRAVDDHRRPTRALPVLRSGILSDPSRRDPLHSSGRTGQPRRGRRSARRSVAFFAQEQNALHLVARPHRDRCRHRRRARPDRQPDEFRNIRTCDVAAVGIRFRAGGGDAADAPDADLRGGGLPRPVRHSVLDVLWPQACTASSGPDVRFLSDLSVRIPLSGRVHQESAGGVRADDDAQHGPMAQHSVHRTGHSHFVPGMQTPRRKTKR